MNIKGLLFLLFFILISCKTYETQTGPCFVIKRQLSSNIDIGIKSGKLGNNPLVVKNGLVYKRYREIDRRELDTTWAEHNQYNIISKNDDFMISLLGDRAKDGVYSLNFNRLEKASNKTKVVYLINGKESKFKEFKRVKKRKKTRIDYSISSLKINDSLYTIINLSVIN